MKYIYPKDSHIMNSLSKTFTLLLFLLICTFASTKKTGIIDGGMLKSCRRPPDPDNAVISYLVAPRGDSKNEGFGVHEYREHDNIYFHCKEGFSQISESTMYITCGSNGQWFPQIKDLGACIKNTHFNKCKMRGLFHCKRSRECISQKKRCDCTHDCDDGSDEIGCTVHRKIIYAPAAGRDSSGIITSPGYPRQYPNNFSCIYHISTFDQNHIEIDFEEFDLPDKVDKKCNDFVRIVGLHPKSLTKRKRRKKKIHSETKCGKNKFKRIFSQHMHISVNISLGHLSKQHRGFAFRWKVRDAAYIENYKPHAVIIPEEEDIKETSADNTYTILTPIAISALIPLLLIIFLCCHRQLRRRCRRNKDDGCKPVDDAATDSTGDSPQNSHQTLMLTENNLALFENQQYKSNLDNHDESQSPDYTESDEYSRRNNIDSKAPCECQCCLKQQSRSSSKELRDKLNRSSYGSNQSEIPRYVMSYDVPLRQPSVMETTSTNPKSNRSPCATPDILDPATSVRKTYSSAPHLNHSLPYRGRHSKHSRDNLRHSYSSQSSSSCKLCSHNKRKHENNFYKHRQQLNDGSNIKQVSEISEVSLAESDYPHQVNEYPEVEYPSTEDLEYSVHPFYDRANHTAFYDFSHNIMPYEPKGSVDIYDEYHRLNTNSQDIPVTSPTSLESYYTDQNIKHQARVMYMETTYGHDIVNTIAYDKRTNEFYPSLDNSADRARGGSLICTH